MTGDRHDEIAARLREEGAARAPERLRADVMLRVRAEPRPRRIRPRRSYWRPLGALAAAACLVGAATFGVSQFGSGSSAGSASSPLEAAANGGTAAGRLPAPSFTLSSHIPGAVLPPTTSKRVAGPSAGAAFANRFDDAPRPLKYVYMQRAMLVPALRQAFAPLELPQGRGTHTP